ncbi:MAG: DUF4262 domain-containing protein [Thermocrispum sp.]
MSAVTVDTAAAALTPEELELKNWLLEQAETRGNAVLGVAPGDGVGNFSFTAGAWRTHGVPEAVVIGLPNPLGSVLLDAYVDRAATGEEFRYGQLYDDFFNGVPVLFQEVAKPFYPQYFGSAFLLYPDGAFPAVQLIVPTPEGQWPWSAGAPDGFLRWQPVLTDSGLPQTRNAPPPTGR